MIRHLCIIVICACCLYASANESKGQYAFDTARVVLNAKMNLISFVAMSSSNDASFSKDYLKGFIDYPIKYSFVSSKGFGNEIVFFKIHAKEVIDTTNKIYVNDSTYTCYEYFGNIDYSFIFGYNLITNEIYRLNGFKEIDFYRLYRYLVIKSFGSEARVLKSRKRMAKHFWIEGLDINCLYTFRKSPKDRRTQKRHKCLSVAHYIYG